MACMFSKAFRICDAEFLYWSFNYIANLTNKFCYPKEFSDQSLSKEKAYLMILIRRLYIFKNKTLSLIDSTT